MNEAKEVRPVTLLDPRFQGGNPNVRDFRGVRDESDEDVSDSVQRGTTGGAQGPKDATKSKAAPAPD